MLKSLRARNIALLVLVVLASQILSFVLVWVLAVRPQAERVGAIMARNVAAISMTMDALDQPRRLELISKVNRGGAVRILPGTAQPPDERGFPTPIERIFIRAFAHEMRANDVVVWQGGQTGQMWARVPMGGTTWWVSYERPKGWSPSGAIFSSFMIAVTMALIGGVLLQRRIAQPLRLLARAADAMRADTVPPPLPTDGPDEIASVARSFNAMAARLSAQEADRTMMVAGLSHDLRTPLAKLRLAKAMMPEGDAEIEATFARQLDQIERMLGQFLDFARGVDGEAVAMVEVDAAIARVVVALECGEKIRLGENVGENVGAQIAVRPLAFERVMANLIGNALTHGAPPVDIIWVASAHDVRISVGDHGPGAPAAMLGDLKRPFTRGDGARASNGSVGLGLAIVDKFAAAHGGTLSYANSPGGGFSVSLSLPRARTRASDARPGKRG